MITLTSKTSIALLITLMKANYGKSWFTRDGEFLVVGIHAPTGEIAYKIPVEYEPYLQGMIELQQPDDLTTTFGDDSSERLLKWSKTL